MNQFFTPMPICRFILMSLPLESLVKNSATPPKAIDYACGASHFLTELALQLKPLVAQHKPQAKLPDYHQAMYGIEKEYRLSKIAKVSAFMYGQQEINICYGDALVSRHESFPNIQDGNFDLLVANPPYSVRGFLETLPEEERGAYTLTDTINDAETANSIETFFVERAKQLLKAGGIAAIILPSSILSNGGTTYIRAREILLQYFDLVAIAEFGSGTFGKTGTNTVTLFLRRKRTAPETADHYRERVGEWFKGCDADKRKQVIYKDEPLIERYAAHIGVPLADYKTLLKGEPGGPWAQHAHFEAYLDRFNKSAELVNLRKQRKFKALSHAEQTAEIARRYLAFAQAIERDKLYHFVMASDQANPVLIIRSPTETKAIKQFLGYDWSTAKGDEGIKLIENADGHHLTPLYDGPDRHHPARFNRRSADKLNHYIAENFEGRLGAIPEALSAVASTARLVDMLDFSKPAFEKQVSLAPSKRAALTSRWPLRRVGELCDLKAGGTPARSEPGYWGGAIKWLKISDFKDFDLIEETEEHITELGLGNSAAKLLAANTVVVTIFATIGRVGLTKVPMTTNQAIVGLTPKSTDLLPYYLMHAVKYCVDQLLAEAAGLAQDNINQTKLAALKVPLPPLEVQQTIVNECKSVDAEILNAKSRHSVAQANIAALVDTIYASSAPRAEIDKLSLAVQYGLSEKMNEAGTGFKIFRMNEVVQGRMVDNGAMKHIDITPEEFAKYKLNRGDLLFIRSNGSLEHIGKVGLFDLDGDYCYASYLVRIVPDGSRVLPRYLSSIMNSEVFRKGMVALAVKSGGTNNINATKMKNIKVPLPPLPEQKKFVAKVEALEREIADVQAVIDAAPARKQAILQKYL